MPERTGARSTEAPRKRAVLCGVERVGGDVAKRTPRSSALERAPGVDPPFEPAEAAPGVPAPAVPAVPDGWSLAASLDELAALADTAGYEVVGRLTQRLRAINPGRYLGTGKIQELRSRAEVELADTVIFDDELSPVQQRNLETELGRTVIDRTALILDIFGQHAHTHEGRLQVELAQQEYLLPRLARRWTHLERQFGRIGARAGAGETQIEVDRRLVRNRIAELKRELEDVRRQRRTQRERRYREGLPVVALVGYTNAGKSTLFNALTRASVRAVDELFATLDPTTRRIALPSGQEALLSDTVGFIQKLPHGLVSAFRATLEELESAALLVHVLDITSELAVQEGETVREVLAELGLADRPVVTALNKIDRALPPGEVERAAAEDAAALAALRAEIEATLGELAATYPHAVLVSAASGWGLDALLSKIGERLRAEWVDVSVAIPYNHGELVALFRERGSVTDEGYGPSGTTLRGRVPPNLLARFERYRTA